MEFEAESPGSHNATVEYDDYRQQLTDKILEERRSQCHHLSDSFDINGQLINRPLLDGGVIFDFLGRHQIQNKRIVRQYSTDGPAGMPHQLETWHLFRVLTSSRDSIRKVKYVFFTHSLCMAERPFQYF